MDHVQLLDSPLDLAHIHQLLLDEGCGASSVFVGTTRDNFQGKQVVSLAYEAYDNMALKEMNKICAELRAKWPELKHLVIHHRLGTVPVKEASVVIAASSPHRAQALESVSFAIDLLKTRVPIWKKEIYAGEHEAEWKENKESIRPKKNPKSPFDYSACPCRVEASHEVPQNLVQIRVNDAELGKRLECFVDRKRAEINSQNVIDFKQNTPTGAAEPGQGGGDSCARTQSSVIKQEKSNCHLKVRRANNRGLPAQPEMRPDYGHELEKLMGSRDGRSAKSVHSPKALPHSRLHTIESYMGMSAGREESMFARIKNIEDRLLHIESISPEYRHFTNAEQALVEPPTPKKTRKKSYSSHELSLVIEKMQTSAE